MLDPQANEITPEESFRAIYDTISEVLIPKIKTGRVNQQPEAVPSWLLRRMLPLVFFAVFFSVAVVASVVCRPGGTASAGGGEVDISE